MEKIVCENSYGQKINLEHKFPYFLEETSGLHEKTSELYSTKSAFGDGEFYVGRSKNKRNIVIYGYFKDKFVERKQFLYSIFPDDDEGTLYYYEDDFSAKTKYRVEKVNIDNAGSIRRFVVSLICFNPYFCEIAENKISLSSWEGGIEFPLEFNEEGLEFETKNSNTLVEIINSTKIESGLTIVFNATGTVINPTIKNIITQEVLTLDYTLEIDDIVTITTELNNKNIILTRNGVETNINNYLMYGTKYLQLKPGTNKFKISADSGIENLIVEMSYSIKYEAV